MLISYDPKTKVIWGSGETKTKLDKDVKHWLKENGDGPSLSRLRTVQCSKELYDSIGGKGNPPNWEIKGGEAVVFVDFIPTNLDEAIIETDELLFQARNQPNGFIKQLMKNQLVIMQQMKIDESSD